MIKTRKQRRKQTKQRKQIKGHRATKKNGGMFKKPNSVAPDPAPDTTLPPIPPIPPISRLQRLRSSIFGKQNSNGATSTTVAKVYPEPNTSRLSFIEDKDFDYSKGKQIIDQLKSIKKKSKHAINSSLDLFYEKYGFNENEGYKLFTKYLYDQNSTIKSDSDIKDVIQVFANFLVSVDIFKLNEGGLSYADAFGIVFNNIVLNMCSQDVKTYDEYVLFKNKNLLKRFTVITLMHYINKRSITNEYISERIDNIYEIDKNNYHHYFVKDKANPHILSCNGEYKKLKKLEEKILYFNEDIMSNLVGKRIPSGTTFVFKDINKPSIKSTYSFIVRSTDTFVPYYISASAINLFEIDHAILP